MLNAVKPFLCRAVEDLAQTSDRCPKEALARLTTFVTNGGDTIARNGSSASLPGPDDAASASTTSLPQITSMSSIDNAELDEVASLVTSFTQCCSCPRSSRLVHDALHKIVSMLPKAGKHDPVAQIVVSHVSNCTQHDEVSKLHGLKAVVGVVCHSGKSYETTVSAISHIISAAASPSTMVATTARGALVQACGTVLKRWTPQDTDEAQGLTFALCDPPGNCVTAVIVQILKELVSVVGTVNLSAFRPSVERQVMLLLSGCIMSGETQFVTNACAVVRALIKAWPTNGRLCGSMMCCIAHELESPGFATAPPVTQEALFDTTEAAVSSGSTVLELFAVFDGSVRPSFSVFQHLNTALSRLVLQWTGLPNTNGALVGRALNVMNTIVRTIHSECDSLVSSGSNRRHSEVQSSMASSNGGVPGSMLSKAEVMRWVDIVNSDPVKGVKKLMTKAPGVLDLYSGVGGRDEDASVNDQLIAFFHGAPEIQPQAIGEFLADTSDEAVSAAKAFMSHLPLHGRNIPNGLRAMLRSIGLPKEGQKIERLLEYFADSYYNQNNGHSGEAKLADVDSCFIVTVAVVMLNTDLHNPTVETKSTITSFRSQLRGCNGGSDFPSGFVEGLFRDIEERPLSAGGQDLAERMMFWQNPAPTSLGTAAHSHASAATAARNQPQAVVERINEKQRFASQMERVFSAWISTGVHISSSVTHGTETVTNLVRCVWGVWMAAFGVTGEHAQRLLETTVQMQDAEVAIALLPTCIAGMEAMAHLVTVCSMELEVEAVVNTLVKVGRLSTLDVADDENAQCHLSITKHQVQCIEALFGLASQRSSILTLATWRSVLWLCGVVDDLQSIASIKRFLGDVTVPELNFDDFDEDRLRMVFRALTDIAYPGAREESGSSTPTVLQPGAGRADVATMVVNRRVLERIVSTVKTLRMDQFVVVWDVVAAMLKRLAGTSSDSSAQCFDEKIVLEAVNHMISLVSHALHTYDDIEWGLKGRGLFQPFFELLVTMDAHHKTPPPILALVVNAVEKCIFGSATNAAPAKGSLLSTEWSAAYRCVAMAMTLPYSEVASAVSVLFHKLTKNDRSLDSMPLVLSGHCAAIGCLASKEATSARSYLDYVVRCAHRLREQGDSTALREVIVNFGVIMAHPDVSLRETAVAGLKNLLPVTEVAALSDWVCDYADAVGLIFALLGDTVNEPGFPAFKRLGLVKATTGFRHPEMTDAFCAAVVDPLVEHVQFLLDAAPSNPLISSIALLGARIFQLRTAETMEAGRKVVIHALRSSSAGAGRDAVYQSCCVGLLELAGSIPIGVDSAETHKDGCHSVGLFSPEKFLSPGVVRRPSSAGLLNDDTATQGSASGSVDNDAEVVLELIRSVWVTDTGRKTTPLNGSFPGLGDAIHADPFAPDNASHKFGPVKSPTGTLPATRFLVTILVGILQREDEFCHQASKARQADGSAEDQPQVVQLMQHVIMALNALLSIANSILSVSDRAHTLSPTKRKRSSMFVLSAAQSAMLVFVTETFFSIALWVFSCGDFNKATLDSAMITGDDHQRLSQQLKKIKSAVVSVACTLVGLHASSGSLVSGGASDKGFGDVGRMSKPVPERVVLSFLVALLDNPEAAAECGCFSSSGVLFSSMPMLITSESASIREAVQRYYNLAGRHQ